MIITDVNGTKKIEITTDFSIIDKLVVYQELDNDEVELIEVQEVLGEVEGLAGMYIPCLTARKIQDEVWLAMDEETPLSKILNYFEKRLEVSDNDGYTCLFDEDDLPSWFDLMVDSMNLKVVKLYEFLHMVGMKE